MNEEWIKIFSTTQLYEAKITEALLKDNDIECYVMNKQDSAYVMIGEVEIYTRERDVETAKALVVEMMNDE